MIAGDLTRDLGLDAAGLGTLLAAWFAAFAAAQIPVGMALDRFGPRWTLATGLGAASLGAVGLAGAGGLGGATVAMALNGAGCAPVLMAGYYLIARNYPLDRFATLSSILLGLGSLGDPVSGMPLALAAQNWGWRSAVACSGAVAALATVGAALLLRDPPRAGRPGGLSRLRSITSVIALRSLWPIVPLGFTAYAAVASTRGIWITPYLESVHGLDRTAASTAATAMGLSMAGGALLYAPLNRMLGGPKRTAALGIFVATAAWLGLGLWGDRSSSLAIGLLLAVGWFGAPFAMLMAHARSFMPTHVVGVGISMMNVVFMGGVSVGQWLSGRYVEAAERAAVPPDALYGHLFLAFGAVLVVTLAIYAFAPPERRTEP